MIDHEGLLKKYIKFVGQCEGVDFITGGDSTKADVEFSPEEWAVLDKMSWEIDDEGLWSE